VPVSLGVASAVHHVFQSSLDLTPFMLFHGANFLSAWVGGLYPGLACTLVGAALVNIFFLAPARAPTLSFAGVLTTLVFVGIGVGVSLLCQSRLRALGAADEAIAVREDFLGVAAHELRTPLTTLGLRLQRLGRRPGSSADDDLAAALRQVLRMDGLIHGLLDAVHLQQARVQLERREVELGELARRVGTRLLPGLSSQLSVEAPGPVVGRWDPARLEMVIANLLLNAFKFGAGKPVHLRVERSGDRALLSVQDQGIGIPQEDQQRIFRRFERAVSVREYGGLGLGLWLASEFVQAHGGTIRVQSNAGKGATFTVDLPLRPA